MNNTNVSIKFENTKYKIYCTNWGEEGKSFSLYKKDAAARHGEVFLFDDRYPFLLKCAKGNV